MSTGRPGRFISLEGGEGVGKSTQVRALAGALRARGCDVVETREPGGSPGAEAIRQLILDGAADRWGPRAEALLFAASRSDHVDRTIRPALARGAWVVSDRFVDSSVAYQGADGLGGEAVWTLHAIGSTGLLPDRTLLLSLSLETAVERETARDAGAVDRFGQRDLAYRTTVEENFRQLAASDPARWRTIDATGTADAVTIRLVHAVEDLL